MKIIPQYWGAICDSCGRVALTDVKEHNAMGVPMRVEAYCAYSGCNEWGRRFLIPVVDLERA